MAFTTTLTAKSAGRATPLCYLIGGAMIAVVGLSFAGFGRRIAHAGSVYAYVSSIFGARCGFVAGWALLLMYVTLLAGATALVGNFGAAGLWARRDRRSNLWLIIAVLAALFAIWLTRRDMALSARLMLVLEGASVLAISLPAIVVLSRSPLSLLPSSQSQAMAGRVSVTGSKPVRWMMRSKFTRRLLSLNYSNRRMTGTILSNRSQRFLGRRIYLPRGKVRGGCSSMNAMIYIPGNRADYDEWAAEGATGWSYDDLLPCFIKSEADERGASQFHGADGSLFVQDGRSQHPLIDRIVGAFVEAGQPHDGDFNGASQIGAGRFQIHAE